MTHGSPLGVWRPGDDPGGRLESLRAAIPLGRFGEAEEAGALPVSGHLDGVGLLGHGVTVAQDGFEGVQQLGFGGGAGLLPGVQSLVGTPGVTAISVSYGGGEFSGETSLDSFFTTPFQGASAGRYRAGGALSEIAQRSPGCGHGQAARRRDGARLD